MGKKSCFCIAAARHAQRRVEVLGVVGDALGGERHLVRRAVDAAVGRPGQQDVRMGERHDLLHELERLDLGCFLDRPGKWLYAKSVFGGN